MNSAWIRLKPHLRAGDQRAGECGDLEAAHPAESVVGRLDSGRAITWPASGQLGRRSDPQTDQRLTTGQFGTLRRVPSSAQRHVEPMAVQASIGVGCKRIQAARIDAIDEPTLRHQSAHRQVESLQRVELDGRRTETQTAKPLRPQRRAHPTGFGNRNRQPFGKPHQRPSSAPSACSRRSHSASHPGRPNRRLAGCAKSRVRIPCSHSRSWKRSACGVRIH